MTTRAVIFDLWGTLLDDGPWRDVFAQMAVTFSVPRDQFFSVWDDIHADEQRGKYATPHHALRAVADGLSISVTDSVVDTAVEAYRSGTASLLQRYERSDALTTIHGLRIAGLRLGLLSNCGSMEAELIPQHSLWPLFDCPVLSCSTGMAKPDRRIFEKVSSGLGVTPQDCLYVADGNHGELEAAESLGMRSILIRSNYADPSSFRLSLSQWPGRRISSLTEVLGHLIP